MGLLVLLVRPPVDTAVGPQLASRTDTLRLTHDEIEREREREEREVTAWLDPVSWFVTSCFWGGYRWVLNWWGQIRLFFWDGRE